MPTPIMFKVLIELPTSRERKRLEGSGLVLPETMLDREDVGSDIGIVRKIGPTCYREEKYGGVSPVKPGDVVYYVRYGGHIIKTKDGKRYRFINDEDIYGLVEESDIEEMPNVE